jgi:hypothetical protein
MTLIRIDLIATLRINETQHDVARSKHLLRVFMLSVTFSYCYSECRHAECFYAECNFL